MFNGITDGSVIIYIIMVVTGVLGGLIWAVPIVPGQWLVIEGIEVLTTGQCLALGIVVFNTVNSLY